MPERGQAGSCRAGLLGTVAGDDGVGDGDDGDGGCSSHLLITGTKYQRPKSEEREVYLGSQC